MLPPTLSEEFCSLQPGVDRLAFSAFFQIDKEGRVVDKSYARTIIKYVPSARGSATGTVADSR